MAYQKEWLNANEQRSYPFRQRLPNLENNVVLDIQITVTTEVALPLRVSECNTRKTVFNLIIEDDNNECIGLFNYPNTTMISLKDECSGRITFNEDLSNSFGISSSNPYTIIEPHTVSTIYKSEVANITIEDNTILQGNIILEEDAFTTFDVTTPESVILNSDQVSPPKCETRVPILDINGTTPNVDGTLFIESVDAGISFRQIEPNILEVSSSYDLADFDSRALTAPRGVSGDAGNQGGPGLDGQQIINGVIVNQYTGLFYNTLELVALYDNYFAVDSAAKDFDSIIGIDREKIFTIQQPVRKEVDQIAEGITYFAGDDVYLIISNTSVISLNEETLETETVWDTFPIPLTGITSNDTSVAVTDGMVAYEYNHSTNQFDIIDLSAPFGIESIKYNNDGNLWVLFNNGTFEIVGGNFLTTDVSTPLVDVYDQWIIGDGGVLIRTDGTQLGTYNDSFRLTTNNNLTTISGTNSNNIIIAGEGGDFYFFRDNVWTKVGTPNVFDWATSQVFSSTEYYILGRYTG